MPPKLSALVTVLNEIIEKSGEDKDEMPPVLILVSNVRTVELIEYFLKNGKTKLRDWLVQGRMTYEHPKEELKEEEEDSPPPKAPRQPEASSRNLYGSRGSARPVRLYIFVSLTCLGRKTSHKLP